MFFHNSLQLEAEAPSQLSTNDSLRQFLGKPPVVSQNCLPLLKSALMAVFLLITVSSRSMAGGGPENVYLLVNASSQDSMTVANHYMSLRDIPASNVQYLEWDKNEPSIHGRKFRDTILLPVLEEIKKRGLTGQIDYLIYSCDFPWKVNLWNTFQKEKFTPGYQPHGSLTGTTYLYAFVLDERKEMLGITSNNYYSMPRNGITLSRGFRSQYRWLPRGQRTDLQGIPYMLSMMLGVTYGRGSKVDEIIRYLELAKGADATHPKGTVYFLKHDGPRSTPRHNLFRAASKELALAGVKSEILEGRFPKGKHDIIGLTTGEIVFDIRKSGCRMLPGSIGDNLTSAGGLFQIGVDQTCLTEFLNNGAAGACGTVHEPLNYPQKFPSPFVHVHYAHGCSLAEAFYQSIHGPFQQLIVGDPLCQPWAKIPEVRVSGVNNGGFVSGELEIIPRTSPGRSQEIGFFELFVDGVRRKRCRAGQSLTIDTTSLSDGYHELRVVVIDNTPIETQGRWIGNMVVKNGTDAVQLSMENQEQVERGRSEYLVAKVASTQKQTTGIVHNMRKLAEISGGNGTARIATSQLGSGPVSLQAVVQGEQGLISRPITIDLP